jgi:tRNA modification GTPase
VLPGHDADVIAAIATPPGQGGIGIVRLSGKRLSRFVDEIIGKPLLPRHATFARFRGSDGRPLDLGLAIFFPHPASYTGEDVLELHAHGGSALLKLLLARCLELGARLADPGEFTKRAYLNGKLDLAQAEAVADLIAASTVTAAKGALRSLQGEFSKRCAELEKALISLRVELESGLDFPDESLSVTSDVATELAAIGSQLEALFHTAKEGSVLREGLAVALLGQPNVGKSSLLNRLAAADVAIVAASPGTTRDVIRERIEIDGVPFQLVDTAGIRETGEEVEQAGVSRAWNAAEKVDVVLLVADASQVNPADNISERLPRDTKLIRVWNKIDLIGAEPRVAKEGETPKVWVSAKTGAGMESLQRLLLDAAGRRSSGEDVFVARERHLHSLRRAMEHVARAGEVRAHELLAEELRLAHESIASIMGEYVSDDLLGEIFSKFCIGK